VVTVINITQSRAIGSSNSTLQPIIYLVLLVHGVEDTTVPVSDAHTVHVVPS